MSDAGRFARQQRRRWVAPTAEGVAAAVEEGMRPEDMVVATEEFVQVRRGGWGAGGGICVIGVEYI